MREVRTVLVVEDEEKIAEVLQSYLEREGYQVLTAGDGVTALRLFREKPISLILLDLMLPDMMGEEVCRTIRTGSRVPIIMLTARTEESDLINGLQMGADDYIYKPFSPRAVMAKVGAVLRRAESDELVSGPISCQNGELVLYVEQKRVVVRGEEVSLTPTEFKLLTTMAKAPNRIFTREQLIVSALGSEYDGYDRSIDTYIKGIRAKLEVDRSRPRYILTVHGMGYKFAGERE